MVHAADFQASVMETNGHAGSQDGGDHGRLATGEQAARFQVVAVNFQGFSGRHMSDNPPQWIDLENFIPQLVVLCK
jgi:hypothetical protein